MSWGNSSSDTTRFKRYPAERVLINDLQEGAWIEKEKNLATRYGKLKRVRICGVIIRRKEVIENNNAEESFIEDQIQTNSRLSVLVDDGTGRLWGTLWGIDPDQYSHIKENNLVDIIGKVRIYQHNPQISIEIIRNLDNPNYESYHMASILKKRKLGPKFEIEEVEQEKFDGFEFDNQDSFEENLEESGKIEAFDYEESKEKKHSESELLDNNSKLIEPGEKEDIKDKIVHFIQENDQGDGVSLSIIAEHFNIEKTELKDILENLCQDIRLYKSQPGHFSSY